MASIPPNDQVVFIMNVLQNTEMPKPDYHAVARNTGSTNANTAQKKFKAIAKSAGFDLVNDCIVRIGDPAIPSPAAAGRAKKGAAAGGKVANGTPKKKSNDNDGTPVKGTKKRKIDDVAEGGKDEMAGNDEESVEEENVEGETLKGGDAK